MEEAPPPGHGRRILANAEAGTVRAHRPPPQGARPRRIQVYTFSLFFIARRPRIITYEIICIFRVSVDIYITDTVYVAITRHYQRHGAVCAHVLSQAHSTPLDFWGTFFSGPYIRS